MTTVRLKEMDGAREVELEMRDGVVFMETGSSCYRFDKALTVRAFERAMGVLMLDLPDEQGVKQNA